MPKRKKPPGIDDVLHQLGALAFGKVNDCVALVLQGENAVLEQLDLSLLAGVKRNKDGSLEVQLVDRLEALRELAALCQEEEPGGFMDDLRREYDRA